MITVFLDEDGKKHQLITQKYTVGTYCIIDSDPAQQFGLNGEESDIHKKIRLQYNWLEEESSTI